MIFNIIASFRNKKINIINILLLSILLLILCIFFFIYDYYEYNINDIYGVYEENRGYIIENTKNINDNLIKNIKKNFNIEKLEVNYNEDENINSYYVVLASYKDTQRFNAYLNSKKITFYLKNMNKHTEIEILEKTLLNFKIYKMIVDLIVIICIFFFIKSIYDKEKSNYVLLKILGYKNYEIINISFGKTIIYYIISFILLTLILIIFKLFLFQTNLGNIRLYLLNLRILKFKQIVYTNFLLICLNNIFLLLKLKYCRGLKTIFD